MPVKLLHIIGRTAGGGGRTVGLNYIAPCVREFETVAITGRAGDLAEQLELRGVRTHRVALDDPTRSVFSILKISRILRRERPDVVVLHGQPAGFTGGLAAKLAGWRNVAYFTCFPSFYTDWDFFRVWRNHLVERVSCRVSRLVFCTCEAARYQYLLRRLADESRLVCVRAGIDLEFVRPVADKAALRARLGLDPERPLVVSVGRLVDQKRVDWLLRAWQSVGERNPEAELVIIGDGPERLALEALGRELQLKRCRFLGFQPGGHAFFEAADLAVVTTLFEAPGFTVLEAMAAGCPVVATAADGVAESVLRAGAGRLVPVADPGALGVAIVELLADRSLRERMAAGGRQFVEAQHSLPAALAEHFALYRRIAGGNGGGHRSQFGHVPPASLRSSGP